MTFLEHLLVLNSLNRRKFLFLASCVSLESWPIGTIYDLIIAYYELKFYIELLACKEMKILIQFPCLFRILLKFLKNNNSDAITVVNIILSLLISVSFTWVILALCLDFSKNVLAVLPSFVVQNPSFGLFTHKTIITKLGGIGFFGCDYILGSIIIISSR